MENPEEKRANSTPLETMEILLKDYTNFNTVTTFITLTKDTKPFDFLVLSDILFSVKGNMMGWILGSRM